MKLKFLSTLNHKSKVAYWMVIALAIYFACISASKGASTFRVEVTGKGDPMILIPGLSSSGDVWKSTVIHYQDHYQCHVLTLAGFAGVPPINDDAFLDHVKNDIISYIKENDLQKPVIIGHSLGGFLALWISSTEPALVGKIIIVDALPFLPAVFYPNVTSQTAAPFAAQMRQQILAQSDEQFKAGQKGTFRNLITDTSVADAASNWGVTSSKETVAEVAYEMQTIDLREEVSKITSPVLVFATWIAYKPYQTHDGIAEVFKAQYAELKNYKLVVTDNAKHFVMLDDPLGFFAETDDFLASGH